MKSENKWNQTVHRQKIPTQGKKTELICSSFWSWGNRLQKWLESLDNNAHIWPELSFILHAQCCHSCQLHSQTKSMITFVSYYLLMKIWFELRCMRVCVCVCVCEWRERDTLATPLGGYSPFSFGSTHCLTLSSLNLGVAYKKELHDKTIPNLKEKVDKRHTRETE